MAKRIGLTDTVPSKSTIALTYKKIPESYLEMAHKLVIAEIQVGHTVAVDSMGFTIYRYLGWLDHKHKVIRRMVHVHVGAHFRHELL